MIRHHVRSFGANKILAIKLVRELTGLGLKEAKDLVESGGSFSLTANAQAVAHAAEEARRLEIVFDPPLDPSMPSLPGHDTLEARGGYSIRYLSGSQLIASIRLVRELTALGLKEAKDLVEQRGVFRVELTERELQDVVQRFLEIDARVEVIGAADASGKPAARHIHDFEKEDNYDF